MAAFLVEICNLILELALLIDTFGVLTVGAVEVGTGDGSSNGGNGNFFYSTENILMSVGILCTVVLVVFGCTWAFWQRIFCFWRKRGTHEAPPDWFIPSSEYGARPQQSSTFTSLDASNLHRDMERGGRSSISIEPFPTLADLGVDARDSFELRTVRTPGIILSSKSLTEGETMADWVQNPEASFKRENLEYQKIIGKGWFGKVLEAEAVNIKPYIRVSNVVVKTLRDDATEDEQKRFLREARVFRAASEERDEASSSNPGNVLKLLGFCVEQMPFILIFEYYPLGDLKSYLKSRAKQAPASLKPGNDGILSRMIIDIVRGLKWMIQSGFVHGDLAARNCLVATSAGKVVIGDYGYSTQKHRADYFWTSNQAIPIRWTAPESYSFEEEESSSSIVAHANEITHEANIWSLGVVIWEVFQLGKMPYDNLTDEDIIRRVLKQGYLLEPPQLPFMSPNIKEKIYQLMVSCWNTSPSLRPRIEEIEQVFITPS